ncbi:MAG: hypothetical protein CL675_02840 [Bdellovibrionaceae bacterium]|nr:hypothetical protein [Pseudobdellovibrionaceae bacterium]|tara:strand:+ start:53 stop:286 length:234 start_codon:yes stop_codon:yes gene_type:complete
MKQASPADLAEFHQHKWMAHTAAVLVCFACLIIEFHIWIGTGLFLTSAGMGLTYTYINRNNDPQYDKDQTRSVNQAS